MNVGDTAPIFVGGPVFIVGMNGSGTTMLLDSLGRSPELYAFPRETRLIPYLLASKKRFGDLDDDDNFRRLWREVCDVPAFRAVNGDQPVELPDNWQSVDRTIPAVIDSVMRMFAARENKLRWCEKTPQHVQHITRLASAFPNASFIHIIRDGRDSAASFHRRWGRTPELTMYRWKKVVEEGRRQGEEVDAYHEVWFEDITRDPEPSLREVCEFLHIPFDPVILKSSQPYLNDDGEADDEGGSYQPNSGKWRSYFPSKRARELERIGGRTLELFGYPTRFPDSDVDPSKMKRRLWGLRDSFWQFGREILLKLQGKIDRPWSVILSRPAAARRQRRANRF